MEDKSTIFAKLIRLHEKELASTHEQIQRLKNYSSFKEHIEKAHTLIPRLEKLIKEFNEQKPLFSKVSTQIEVGALACIHSTQYGDRYLLIVHDTEVTILNPEDYGIMATKLSEFEFKQVGEAIKYWNGRPGEQFEVTATLLWIK